MPMSRMNDRIAVPLIAALSVIVPLVVAALLYVPTGGQAIETGFDIYFLPFLNAILNSAVSLLLIAGYVFIRQRWIQHHKAAMLSAFALSVLFLVSYISYHYLKGGAEGSTSYGGEGFLQAVYYFVLLTHILLAIAVVPLALFSIYRGLNSQLARHRRIARWTLPIWLYVSITGVIVYLMISPYYPD